MTLFFKKIFFIAWLVWLSGWVSTYEPGGHSSIPVKAHAQIVGSIPGKGLKEAAYWYFALTSMFLSP